MEVLNDIFAWSVGTIIVTFIVSILISILVVAFWTWFVSSQVFNAIDKRKEQQGNIELNALLELVEINRLQLIEQRNEIGVLKEIILNKSLIMKPEQKQQND